MLYFLLGYHLRNYPFRTDLDILSDCLSLIQYWLRKMILFRLLHFYGNRLSLIKSFIRIRLNVEGRNSVGDVLRRIEQHLPFID